MRFPRITTGARGATGAVSVISTALVLLLGIAPAMAQIGSGPDTTSFQPTNDMSPEPAIPRLCQTDSDCPGISAFCDRPVAHCDGTGRCRIRPAACTSSFAPVCGCDGITYANPCLASAAGISVSHIGACAQPLCCDPSREPGEFGNPLCIEGASCCSDGEWRCNEGDGSSTCEFDGQACAVCCDQATQPGINGNPICVEGATCCADGDWQCNEGDGSSTCNVDGIVCDGCCNPLEEPGFGGNPLCVEGHSCCSDGQWRCNGAGANSVCGLEGVECSGLCCDPLQEPGQYGNPLCVEGATCCSDGQWSCNEGDGSSTCDLDGIGCETCCNPAEEPGTNGSPLCIEGASCCATGDWQCNNGAAESTCGLDGLECEDCCDLSARPGFNGNPPCVEGATCCSDGQWACNDGAGSSTCDLGGQTCDCCDPLEQPGHYGNPLCVEGATCCGNGEWRCNDAGGQSTCDDPGEVCGQVCGGFAGIPCPDGAFCKTDFGQCCCDFQGVCLRIPPSCPAVFDPVCGCDGVTYVNECEADAAGVSVDHPGACTGACCLPDGGCVDGLAQDYCESVVGGTFQGAGSSCAFTQCPVQTGKCCLPDGSCQEVDPTTCADRCGAFSGPGTTCGPDVIGSGAGSSSTSPDPDPNPQPVCPVAPTGACCLADDSCEETHGQCVCESQGGSYEGDDTTCDLTFCPDTCVVDESKTLMIIEPDVVDDPVRTTCTGPNPADCGPWTFAAIAAAVAGTEDRRELSDFVLDLFGHFDVSQTINTFNVPPRPNVQNQLVDPWIAQSGGNLLDFGNAPFRLLAIVNRPDLRNDDPSLEAVKAGEGRFVFAALPGGNFTDFFTIIFEFKLPGTSCGDVLDWQLQWHALGSFPDFGPAYRDALQAITDQFAAIGADPGSPNGSALAQFRTNEFLQPVSPWELREWRLLCPGDSACPSGGEGQCSDTGVLLTESTVEQTPDIAAHNNSQILADFMNEFSTEILSGSYRLPCSYQGSGPGPVPFRGGHSPVSAPFNPLSGQGVDPAVRDVFALNTCSGCHRFENPSTPFQHINERLPGQPASLSSFLIQDLAGRAADLCDNILTQTCGGGGVDPSVAPMQPVPADRAGRAH